MKKRIFYFIVVALLALNITSPAISISAADDPSFSTSTATAGQNINVDDTFTITVNGHGLKDMYAFEIALVFDSGLLKYDSSNTGVTGQGMQFQKERDGNKVLFAFTRMGEVSGDNGDMTLCKIRFKALAAGNAMVKLDSVKIVHSDESFHIYAGSELNVLIGLKENGNDNDDGGTDDINNGNTNIAGNGQPPLLTDIASESIPGSDIGGTISNVKLDLNKSTGIAIARIGSAELQKAFDQAPSNHNNVKTVKINISETVGAEAYEVVLPSDFFTSKDSKKSIEISTVVGNITVIGNMLAELNVKGMADISLSIARGDRTKIGKDVLAQIGDKPILELSLKASGKSIPWSSHNSIVKVSVPYKPSTAELQDPEHITVWYLDGSGKPISVPNGRYDTETGMVTFNTSHFSTYAVTFVKKTFTDLSGYSWASREVEVLASKGIIRGVSDKKFAPAANITRADFVILLVRTLGLNSVVDSNFSDVHKKDYYFNELGIAKKLGIDSGAANNMFNPKTPITRQDMMVMTAKAMKIAGILDSAGDSAVLGKFSDRTKIASYAVDSVAALVNEGLIKGSNNRINPLAKTTRAEVAVLMYGVYKKIL